MQSIPVVSVVMPVYNTAEYLREAVDSILSQSLADFELIMIDDGCTDDSGEIIDGYARSDDRVRQQPYRAKGGCPARLKTPVSVEAGLFIHPSVTGRTEWFQRNPYDESFARAEDHELLCRTCLHSRFALLRRALLYYRENAKPPWPYLRYYLDDKRVERVVFRRYGPQTVGGRRTALILLIRALDMPHESEAITPSFTFAGTAHALLWNDLKPVFCDSEPDSFTMDASAAEALVTDRTSAIYPARMGEVNAAVGRWSLARLDAWIANRTALTQCYHQRPRHNASHSPARGGPHLDPQPGSAPILPHEHISRTRDLRPNPAVFSPGKPRPNPGLNLSVKCGYLQTRCGKEKFSVTNIPAPHTAPSSGASRPAHDDEG